MDEEVLNNSLRRFLKKVGITAQREIEKAGAKALPAASSKAMRRCTPKRRSRSPASI